MNCGNQIINHMVFNSTYIKFLSRPISRRWQHIVRMVFSNLPDWCVKFFKLYIFAEDVCDYFIKIVREMVKHREENNIIRGDFLDLLIAIKNDKKIDQFDDSRAEQIAVTKFIKQVGEKNNKINISK